MKKYILTPEGENYLKNGLPELNLVEILKKPMPVQEARRRVENFNIALQWAKKKGWVKIDGGKLFLIKKASQIPEKNALLEIRKSKKTKPKMLNILLKRRLVTEEKITGTEKFVGKTITNLTPQLIKTGLWRRVKLKPYNVSAVGKKIYPGKKQPYTRFLSSVRQKLVELGFKEMTGPIIETEFWNFDALYQAQDHPARDWTQTYSLKTPNIGDLPDKTIVKNVKATHENGWKTGSTGWGYKWSPQKAARLMPRAHGTALSARTLAGLPEIPGKYFAIVRCFRPDVIDTTHGVEFNQVEGIVIDKNLSFKNLLGILKQFAIEFTDAEEVKFRPDYFPFTEPSCEMSVKDQEMGWVEIGGAGIFRPELTLPLGVKEPVIAWGLGIDRLAMCKLNITDIRHLFSQNITWLRDRRVIL